MNCKKSFNVTQQYKHYHSANLPWHENLFHILMQNLSNTFIVVFNIVMMMYMSRSKQ